MNTTMNRNGFFEERRRADDCYQRWFRHVQYPRLTPGEWRETLDKHRADGRDPRRLGALGQVGGDEDGRGREGLGHWPA